MGRIVHLTVSRASKAAKAMEAAGFVGYKNGLLTYDLANWVDTAARLEELADECTKPYARSLRDLSWKVQERMHNRGVN